MLAVFSRLELAAEDRERIEGFRREHDPQHSFVEAHFTHVFPCSGIRVEEVAAHVAAVAAETETIPFRLSAAVPVRDPFDPLSRVFLLPSEGATLLEALHARLYSGVLAPYLRADLPYQPHVTVAAFDEHSEAERVALTFGEVDIEGRLTALELAQIKGGQLRELQGFPLKSS